MRAAFRFAARQAHARPLAVFATMFLLGLLLERACAVPSALCAAALALPLGLWLYLRRRRRSAALALLAAGILCGMLRMGLAIPADPFPQTQYSVEMIGSVASEPFLNANGRLVVRCNLETANGEASDLSLRLYLRGDATQLNAIDYGQRLRFVGHIWRPDPVTNPYEFDFGAYLIRQEFDGYATAKIEDVQILETRRDFRSAIIAARHGIANRIDRLFPKNAAMMRALVLGDRSQLGEELRDSMNRSGTAHLISISGMHVTVLSMLLAAILSRFMPRRRANLLAVALLLPYGALIGFSMPFVRALAMFAILCFAPVAGVPSDAITRLCAVLLACLIVKPLRVDDAGFALSFSASAGIILLTPLLTRLTGVDALQRRKPHPKRLRRIARRVALYFPALLCASLAAQLATLPSVIAFFGVQSLVALPFNLICVPLCMLGYILGLVALAVSIVSVPLGAALARLPDGAFTLLLDATRFGARIPASVVRIGRYPAVLALAHWMIVLAASDLTRFRLKARAFICLGLLVVAGLSTLLVFSRSWDFSITQLDAGQADCAVVRTRGHTYMIDVGDTYTPATDYLNATCLRLDAILLTHPHEDHAGGLKDVLTSFKPNAIYVPVGWFDAEDVSPAVLEGIELARSMGVGIRELQRGDSLALSETARLDVYSPNADDPPTDVNDLSLMTLIRCDDATALFTGDLSQDYEPDDVPDADVLKVAHHGSAKGSSERFLRTCSPRIAVITAGENNYGHPNPQTLEKLEAVGATILLTRDCGAITLTPRGGTWRVDTFLEASDEME